MNAKAAIAWAVAAPCALWALWRLSGIALGFPFSALIAYTPYVVPVALVVVVVALLLRQPWPAVAAGLSALVLAALIVPRMVGEEKDFGNEAVVRVMSANVLRGAGDAEQLIDLADERSVDVLAVQELTPDLIEDLREAGIREDFRYSTLAPRRSVAGSGIYSRYPLRDKGTLGVESFEQCRARVLTPAGSLDVTSVHPNPPTGPAATDDWRASLDLLPHPEEDGAVQLLLGDFNATLDHPEFREILDRGYVDAADDAGDGLVPTWPTFDKSLPYLPVTIDHVVAEEDAVGVISFDVLELDGSDHKPVYAELYIDRD